MSEYSRLFNSGADPTRIILNPGTDDQLVCYGYRANRWKLLLFILLSCTSLGFVLLLMLWRPELECYIKRKKCHLTEADTILIQDHVKRWFVSPVKTKGFDEFTGVPDKYHQFRDVSDDDESDSCDTTKLKQPDVSLRYFDHQHLRYIWEQDVRSFVQLQDLSYNTKCSTLQESFQGLTQREQAQKRVIYEDNLIDVEVKSYWRLFIEEVMNPFYIFQIFSIILWLMDNYYYYAACIFLISLISITVSLRQIKKQSVALHDMVTVSEQKIEVCQGQGRGYQKILTSCLVPGDLIVLPQNGCTMTCDAVLITGTCIVNESMLTGESVPVTKTPLTHQEDEEIYSSEAHKRHTLFSGTHIMQTRYYGSARVTAVVVRTGFRTAKGELVRSILFPKPIDFQFYRDSMKFVMFLGFIAAIGMIYTVVLYVRDGIEPFNIVLRVLDVITIIVPAALPAAMTIGTAYAQNRLKKDSIYCISPPRINFGGRLDAFCFDKTGTLTEDGLDMMGAIPVHNNSFLPLQTDPSRLDHGPMLNAMATCHSLTMMDGELSGDPLDQIMFESTKWVLKECKSLIYTLTVNGKSLSVITNHLPDLLSKICVVGTVFARMKPDQKCQLIHKLQSLGYHVGMCGDGANDCEALKAAHVGISLSEAEASIAAPFTSSIPHIECVYTVIREGRAALTTSFACFKYMALYSFIQFVSVMILYSIMGEYKWALFYLTSQMVSTSGGLILPKITKHVQVGALFYLKSQTWYTRALPSHDAENTKCWETTIIFLVSSYLYMAVAFCFSRGPPYRKPIYTNIPYLIYTSLTYVWEKEQCPPRSWPYVSTRSSVGADDKNHASVGEGADDKNHALWEKEQMIKNHASVGEGADDKSGLALLFYDHMILCVQPDHASVGEGADDKNHASVGERKQMIKWAFIVISSTGAKDRSYLNLQYILTATKCVKKNKSFLQKETKTGNTYKHILGEMMMTDWPPVSEASGNIRPGDQTGELPGRAGDQAEKLASYNEIQHENEEEESRMLIN
ncbi:polyamine-transporting ATPase 13A3-like [Argopecten irradians]|uniref:polyamine-transporting ATPase 13A3-like n=1 Tax=Argopecten irradians TaxID=31199 RepID=UPI00371908E5